MTEIFVPRSTLTALAEGSFEHLRDQVAEAVDRSSDKIFGTKIPVKIIGTFSEHVVVAAQDGRFCRVKYQVQDGVQLGESTPVTVPGYSASELPRFAEQKAQEAVQAFLNGDRAALSTQMAEMAQVLDERPRMTDDEIASKLINIIGQDRPWKKTFEQKKLEIKSAIVDCITRLEDTRLSAKFERLHSLYGDQSIPSDKLENYRVLVDRDFRHLQDRLVALTNLISIAMESVEQVKPQNTAVVEAFVEFGSSLLQDLTETCQIVVESPERLRPLGALSRMYDCLAESLHNYEVAGRYCVRMASKICGIPS